jgi:hypothetical protein
MIYSITASRDATIYEGTGAATDLDTKYMNTGGSEILEINKIISSSQTVHTYNSRMLLYFNIDWPGLVGLGMPTASVSRSAYLNLYSTEANNIARSHSLSIHPVSKNWDVGTGRATNKPKTKDGVSWTNYKGEDITGHPWITASVGFTTGETGSNGTTNNGGGQWWTSSVHTHSYNYNIDPNTSMDMRTDVKNILSDWSSSVVDNNGFIIKLSGSFDSTTSLETDKYKYGNVKYFSRNTHTIYPPRLEICWDDKSWTTGSMATALDMSDPGAVFVYLKNNRGSYKRGGKIKFRTLIREKYPVKTYGNTSAELTIQRMGVERWCYSIIDCKTGETIIPYDDTYTNMSCDTSGNYFEIFSDSLFEERDYKIQLRYRPTATSVDYTYYDIKDTFKVVR